MSASSNSNFVIAKVQESLINKQLHFLTFSLSQVGFLQYLNSMVLTVVPWYLVCFLAWFTTLLLLVQRKKTRPYNTRRNDDINKVVVTIFFLCVIAMLSFLPSLVAFFFHEEYRVVPDDKYPLWVWYFCIVYSPALSSFFNPIILVIRGRGMRTTLQMVVFQLARCQGVKLQHDGDMSRVMSLNMTRFNKQACSVHVGKRRSDITKSTGVVPVNTDFSRNVQEVPSRASKSSDKVLPPKCSSK